MIFKTFIFELKSSRVNPLVLRVDLGSSTERGKENCNRGDSMPLRAAKIAIKEYIYS